MNFASLFELNVFLESIFASILVYIGTCIRIQFSFGITLLVCSASSLTFSVGMGLPLCLVLNIIFTLLRDVLVCYSVINWFRAEVFFKFHFD
jgi:hypothetical protein